MKVHEDHVNKKEDVNVDDMNDLNGEEVSVEYIGAEEENYESVFASKSKPNEAETGDTIVGLEPEIEVAEDINAESEPEEPPPPGKDLPKRVLAYSTLTLLGTECKLMENMPSQITFCLKKYILS